MGICGLQKLTLLDYPGRVACTIFLGGCNFRCPFCHNAQLVLDPAAQPELSRQELSAFLHRRRGILDGACVTGGEPLLWPGLDGLLEELKALGYLVKLDTNGSVPGRLQALAARGLVDSVAMDIKAGPDHYGLLTGVPDLDLAPIRETADWLMHSGIDYEFRTTVVSPLHTQQDFEQIGRWLAGAKKYFLQGFVDSGGVLSPGLCAYDREQMEHFRQIAARLIPSAALRGVD